MKRLESYTSSVIADIVALNTGHPASTGCSERLQPGGEG
jgi:hypothetical protein